MNVSPSPAEQIRQAQEREATLRMVETKIGYRQAGIDPYERDVLIVELADPFRRGQLMEIGNLVGGIEQHYKPDGERVYRVRVHVTDPVVRARLGLNEPDVPVLEDVSLASRNAHTTRAQREIDAIDRSRNAGRRWGA